MPLCYICYMVSLMPRSDSGRIVLEVDPKLKSVLYALLALDQMTLREWFIDRAESYISNNKADLSTLRGVDKDEV